MRIHYLQHVSFENPGSILKWIQNNNHELSVTRLFNDDRLPAAHNFDLLIILGGPMGVYDDQKYPWLTGEKKFIADAIRLNKKVLGICLGAQLIASALGARVYKNDEKEIGWFPINVVAGDESSPFKDFPPNFMAFHWHGDTYDLPSGARLIAESDACRNQAFSVGEKVLALQFHLEVTLENIELLIQNCGIDLKKEKFIQTTEQIRDGRKNIEVVNRYMNQIMDRFTETA